MAIWKIRSAGDGNLKVTWQETWDVAEEGSFATMGTTPEEAIKAIRNKVKKVDCTPESAPREGVQDYVYGNAVPGDLIIDGGHIGFLHLAPPELS